MVLIHNDQAPYAYVQCHNVTMSDTQSNHVVRNCLMFAYRALRMLERFIKGTHFSPYKDFFEKVLQRKLESEVPNSEVEAFYLGRQSEGEFVAIAESRLFGGGGVCVCVCVRPLVSITESTCLCIQHTWFRSQIVICLYSLTLK